MDDDKYAALRDLSSLSATESGSTMFCVYFIYRMYEYIFQIWTRNKSLIFLARFEFHFAVSILLNLYISIASNDTQCKFHQLRIFESAACSKEMQRSPRNECELPTNSMDGWMDVWMDKWRAGWMDDWIDGLVDGSVGGWMDGWVGGWMSVSCKLCFNIDLVRMCCVQT